MKGLDRRGVLRLGAALATLPLFRASPALAQMVKVVGVSFFCCTSILCSSSLSALASPTSTRRPTLTPSTTS